MKSLFCLVLLVLLSSAVYSQSPEAKAAFDEAKSVAKSDPAKAIALFRKAIEIDPNYVEAHEQFMSVSRSKLYNESRKPGVGETESDEALKKAMDDWSKQTIATYEEWSLKYPKSPAVQWELGELYMYKDYDKVESQAKKALEIDPKFTRAYQTLSLIEEVRGNEKKRLEYLAKAAESAPDDPAPSFYYASALRKSNPELNRKKSLEVAERFPQSERGAQALYWLAFETDNREEKIRLLEKARLAFPPQKFNWSESCMSLLFETYGKTDPLKALALAQEMEKTITEGSGAKTWQVNAAYQKNLVEAQKLITSRKYDEAVALLTSTTTPRYSDTTPYALLKAEAAAGTEGGVQKAYDALVKQMADAPTDPLRAATLKYGASLKKATAEVDADIWRIVESKATPAPGFTFPRYPDEKRISLADYRGKVVMINLWYPFCGPCRGEAPYLQRVAKKFGPEKFVILAINVHPNEDQFVMPYMKGNAYDFIPLRAEEGWASRDYKARGYPANYIVDQEGRIVYKPGVVRGTDGQRKLEMQIETILSRPTAATKTASK